MNPSELNNLIQAAFMASREPINIQQLKKLFLEDDNIDTQAIRQSINALQLACEGQAIELREIAGGYRYQVRQQYAEKITELTEAKPQRYSRALLEILSLIAYRQPITRGEIESIRGVSVSSHIVKTLLERDWIKILGHREVPGRPVLYGTTPSFLAYFNLKSLNELPSIAELNLKCPEDDAQQVLELEVVQKEKEEGEAQAE